MKRLPALMGPVALAITAALPLASCMAEGGTAPPRSTNLAQQSPEVLADLVNDYRERNGLPRVPISPLLTRVAEAHMRDMARQGDGGLDVLDMRDPASGKKCSAHSWSDDGNWTPVCFTLDGRYAQAMWDKPREITRGVYKADGIEIAAWDSYGITPDFALKLWQGSPAHDHVIRETDVWRGSDWKAMGVAIGGHYAYIWFGKDPDPNAKPG